MTDRREDRAWKKRRVSSMTCEDNTRTREYRQLLVKAHEDLAAIFADLEEWAVGLGEECGPESSQARRRAQQNRVGAQRLLTEFRQRWENR